jgi:hypothetical protein
MLIQKLLVGGICPVCTEGIVKAFVGNEHWNNTKNENENPGNQNVISQREPASFSFNFFPGSQQEDTANYEHRHKY